VERAAPEIVAKVREDLAEKIDKKAKLEARLKEL
jgi:hypothetical protein